MTEIQSSINELCDAVLACDYSKPETKAWARDLKRRNDGNDGLKDAFDSMFNTARGGRK